MFQFLCYSITNDLPRAGAPGYTPWTPPPLSVVPLSILIYRLINATRKKNVEKKKYDVMSCDYYRRLEILFAVWSFRRNLEIVACDAFRVIITILLNSYFSGFVFLKQPTLLYGKK